MSCLEANFIRMSSRKQRMNLYRKEKAYFLKKSIFCTPQSAYFGGIFGSVHGHVERISSSTATDMTFIIPIHYRMMLRVLFICLSTISEGAEKKFTPPDDFVAPIKILNILLEQIR